MSVGRHTSRLLVSALLGAALLFPASAHAAFPGANGKIAFDNHNPPGTPIHTINPDGTGESPLVEGEAPAWSPDGRRLAFTRPVNGEPHIFISNADGSGVTDLNLEGMAPAWSPDGTMIVYSDWFCFTAEECVSNIFVKTLDTGDAGARVPTCPNEFDCRSLLPSWSPDGGWIAFYGSMNGDTGIYKVRPDGTGLTHVVEAYTDAPDWSPNGSRIVFKRNDAELAIIHADGDPSTLSSLDIAPGGEFNFNPSWSPDGTKIVFLRLTQSVEHLYTINPDGTDKTLLTAGIDPSWQPLPVKGYPRPRSATPVRVSLVPAYEECTTPDRTHGPPLAHPSCRLSNVGGTSDPESAHLTVGTPDSNGAAAQFTGFVRMKVAVGDPATPADEADVRLDAAMVDVRCYSAVFGPPHCARANTQDGPDYDGELEARVSLRLTDKDNTPHPGGPGPATVTDTTFAFPIQCAQTEDADIGGSCSTVTSAEALIPGAVKERARAVWQLGAVAVHDGGADGDADTAPNTPFLRQGVYIP